SDECPSPMPEVPRREPLLEIHRRLDAAGIDHALSGSGLLHALGLAESVRDWDLKCDADPEAVEACLEGLDYVVFPPNGIFATAAMFVIRLGGASIDLMSRFAIETEHGRCALPALSERSWHGV